MVMNGDHALEFLGILPLTIKGWFIAFEEFVKIRKRITHGKECGEKFVVL